MRFVVLLSMGTFCTNYSMENNGQRDEPVVCSSIAAGYCMELMIGERQPLLRNQGNIQQAPPEPIEVQTCKEFYQHHKKKIWCCGVCCCMTCSCMAINSINNVVKNVKTMTTWCFGD